MRPGSDVLYRKHIYVISFNLFVDLRSFMVIQKYKGLMNHTNKNAVGNLHPATQSFYIDEEFIHLWLWYIYVIYWEIHVKYSAIKW